MRRILYLGFLIMLAQPMVYAEVSSNPTEAKIQAIITEVNASLADGGLVPNGPGKSAQGRVNAFLNKLNAALNAAQSNGNQDAVVQLEGALNFATGDAKSGPLFSDDGADKLYRKLQFVINYLNGAIDVSGAWWMENLLDSNYVSYIVLDTSGLVEDYHRGSPHSPFTSGTYTLEESGFTATVYNANNTPITLSCSLDSEATGICTQTDGVQYSLNKINPAECSGSWLGQVGSGETPGTYYRSIASINVNDDGTVNSIYTADANAVQGRLYCQGNKALLKMDATGQEHLVFRNYQAPFVYSTDLLQTKLTSTYFLSLTRYPLLSFEAFSQLPEYFAFYLDDTDGDGIINRYDTDIDGDGRINARDNCPLVPNRRQTDRNRNGIGDACE
ncbi:MAG: thrombospondin type 3 repeat-containing protein [Gammaproteobacteria bacterium]|nr:thrombospondin type 3 repeat-containing protein [Gammaproteobacteria bacterium]